MENEKGVELTRELLDTLIRETKKFMEKYDDDDEISPEIMLTLIETTPLFYFEHNFINCFNHIKKCLYDEKIHEVIQIKINASKILFTSILKRIEEKLKNDIQKEKENE